MEITCATMGRLSHSSAIGGEELHRVGETLPATITMRPLRKMSPHLSTNIHLIPGLCLPVAKPNRDKAATAGPIGLCIRQFDVVRIKHRWHNFRPCSPMPSACLPALI